MWPQRLCAFIFIELGSRRVHVAGCTPNPSAPGVTQQARQLTWTLAERPESFRFLIRDRDQKFTDGLDKVFRSIPRVQSVALQRRRRGRPDRGELTADSGQRIATAIRKPIPRQLQEPATRCSERTCNRRFVRGPVADTR